MASFTILDSDPEVGPPMRAGGLDGAEVSSAADYQALIEEAGFSAIDIVDLTDEYEATTAAWIREWSSTEDELIEVMGRELYEERQELRRTGLAAVRAGTRHRILFTAIRP